MAKYYEVVSKQPHSEKTALISKSKVSYELDLLNKTDSIIIQKVEECCSYNQTYKILNNKQTFYRAIQENHCCSQAYEDVFIFDFQDRPIVQIERTEFCGYISKNMKFRVSSPPGNPIGEINRKMSFLEKDQFEICDNETIFSVVNVDNDYYLSTKKDKLAQAHQNGNVYIISFTSAMTSVAKMTFICFIILLDLVKQERIN